MSVHYVIGIDPGPVTGVVGLWLNMRGREAGPDVMQCSAHLVIPRILVGLVTGLNPDCVVVAIERFVLGRFAAHGNAPAAGQVARSVVEVVHAWTARTGTGYVERNAGDVKPWASDARLRAAGLVDITMGMRHARDAARHALYAAVLDCGLPDPLSKQGWTVRA